MRKRPFGVTLLAFLVLLVAASGLARSVQAVQKWAFLDEILQIWPGYMLLHGLIWFALGLGLFWMLWTMHPKAGPALLAAMVAYSITFWLEQLYLQAVAGTGAPLENWLFMALINVLGIAWGVREFYRPGIQETVEDRYEQRPEN
jgi:hypothetical protein